MPDIITGDPSTITTPLSRSVSGATNASPIVITTSASHLFATADVVVISGVGGNTAANGTFSITKLTPTTFELDGSTGNGAYTSGGTALNTSLTPQFQIPADGDGPGIKAADVAVAFEALADRTQFLQREAHEKQLRTDEFTASGTWVAPADVTRVVLEGCGGGGGGGGASDGDVATDNAPAGGGGGGGAILSVRSVSVVPGTTYNVVIGAGGSGGTPGSGGTSTRGDDGSDTTFGGFLAVFRGAAGGGNASSGDSTNGAASYGGSPTRLAGAQRVVAAPTTALVATLAILPRVPSAGGFGISSNLAPFDTRVEPGVPSTEGFIGGAAGAVGVDDGSYLAGGPGGGGGSGPYAPGADGGSGGNANSAGAGSNGAAGAAGGANSGSGGGGGGGGGSGNSAGGTGATGGAGGSGRLRVSYVGPQAVIT
jgi:hypothetical protein